MVADDTSSISLDDDRSRPERRTGAVAWLSPPADRDALMQRCEGVEALAKLSVRDHVRRPRHYRMCSSAQWRAKTEAAFAMSGNRDVIEPLLLQCEEADVAIRASRNREVIELLQSWCEEDAEEQRATLTHLKRTLDRNRLSRRKLFP